MGCFAMARGTEMAKPRTQTATASRAGGRAIFQRKESLSCKVETDSAVNGKMTDFQELARFYTETETCTKANGRRTCP